MDIGKKQQIMVDWFKKTLDESKNLGIPRYI